MASLVHHYEVIAQSRTPNSVAGGWPTLTELGPVKIKQNLSFSHELWGDGGYIELSCEPDELSDSIKECFADPFMHPSELKLYRDGELVQQGPVISTQVQGTTGTIIARGLLYYVRHMYVTDDLTYTGTDQYTIVKNLINHHQNKTYGNFGLDTSGIGLSGVTLDRKYKKDRLHNVMEEIDKLAQREFGFDYYVTYDENRDVILTARRGADRRRTVYFDARGIVSPQIAMSCSAGEVASEVFIVGRSFEAEPVYIDITNSAALAAFGRAIKIGTFDNVDDEIGIGQYANTILGTYDQMVFNPGTIDMMPVLGCQPVEDFDVGDQVSWYYDAGFGYQLVQRDLKNMFVNVDENGQETMTVEFV